MPKDITLTTAQGWNLIASHDGEQWTLHVENGHGQGASLTAATFEGEVYCPEAQTEVRTKGATAALFDRWHEQYDAFTEEAAARAKMRGF